MNRRKIKFYKVITNVLIGNLAPPVRNAVNAILLLTPHNSNKILPPAIRAAQKLTDPFPFPILTSIGLSVTGNEGKTLIHNFPFLFIFLVIDCLAASI